MKKYYLLLLFCCFCKMNAQDKFTGNWRTDDGLQIEIYIQKEAYYAKIKSCRNEKLNDKVVLIQMIKKSTNQLYGGMYYDDALKSEYEAKLKLIGQDTMRMKIMAGLSSKKIIWYRN